MFFGLFGGEKKRVAEMIVAARTGNIEKVKQLLSRGVDINAPGPESGERPSSPKGEIIEVGLFGAFQFDEDEPDHYKATDVGWKCLINIPGWGDVDQAQLFYQPGNDGDVKYQFRNYWEGPGYDTTNDKDLYTGRR